MQNPLTPLNYGPDANGRGEVRAIVHAVVKDVAPAELPIVDALEHVDDLDIVKRFQRKTRREPLGLGLDEVTTLATAVLWLVLSEFADQTVAGVVEGARGRLKKLFRRKAARRLTLPALSGDRLKAVRAAAFDAAVDQGMSERDAAILADTLIARIAIGESPELPESDEDGPR